MAPDVRRSLEGMADSFIDSKFKIQKVWDSRSKIQYPRISFRTLCLCLRKILISLVMRPHADHLDHPLLFQDLVDQSVLYVYPS